MAEALNPTYWVVMAIYIGLCGLFQTPNVDRNDPFSYSDNINRQKFWLLLLMLPGKIMVMTGTATG